MKSELAPRRSRRAPRARQSGYSITEIIIGIGVAGAIALLVGVAYKPTVTTAAAKQVAEDLKKYVATELANSHGVNQPYAGVSVAGLGLVLRDSGALTISSDRSRVAHGLGGNGTTTGLIAVAPANGGNGFTITLDAVGHAACPNLANLLRKSVTKVVISGQSTATVYDTSVNPAVDWQPAIARAACAEGDNNTFVFSVGAI